MMSPSLERMPFSKHIRLNEAEDTPIKSTIIQKSAVLNFLCLCFLRSWIHCLFATGLQYFVTGIKYLARCKPLVFHWLWSSFSGTSVMTTAWCCNTRPVRGQIHFLPPLKFYHDVASFSDWMIVLCLVLIFFQLLWTWNATQERVTFFCFSQYESLMTYNILFVIYHQ